MHRDACVNELPGDDSISGHDANLHQRTTLELHDVVVLLLGKAEVNARATCRKGSCSVSRRGHFEDLVACDHAFCDVVVPVPVAVPVVARPPVLHCCQREVAEGLLCVHVVVTLRGIGTGQHLGVAGRLKGEWCVRSRLKAECGEACQLLLAAAFGKVQELNGRRCLWKLEGLSCLSNPSHFPHHLQEAIPAAGAWLAAGLP
mmetsp:Transcript_34544/g.80226  ORF Transcript_34544/g.80226 Transcript_34544/m.80226 type:complete len:202 (-) Transcript_34544:124-729(-)